MTETHLSEDDAASDVVVDVEVRGQRAGRGDTPVAVSAQEVGIRN